MGGASPWKKDSRPTGETPGSTQALPRTTGVRLGNAHDLVSPKGGHQRGKKGCRKNNFGTKKAFTEGGVKAVLLGVIILNSRNPPTVKILLLGDLKMAEKKTAEGRKGNRRIKKTSCRWRCFALLLNTQKRKGRKQCPCASKEFKKDRRFHKADAEV